MMKLASFRRPDKSDGWGVVTEAGIVDLGSEASSLRRALADNLPLRELALRKPDFRLADIELLPPIPDPQKIICIGLNYRSHILETGREAPAKPVVFTRFANSQIGHGQPMIRPNVSEQLDFEGELAVVIGKRGRHVKRENALDHVIGYSCYNDGSVRDWQRHTHQFAPGKNFVATGGFGPWIVTTDEAGDVTKATLVTRLNGREVQRTTIDDLLFDVSSIIEYCSTFTELSPGDVIATGTTGGVGAARKPPLWMKPGDVVEVEISCVGVLRNVIEQEAMQDREARS
jgi:2-keto-4-pentenoate hydratase/2-oxohepta-3-ene-1,7-dioic acid hydratase in catechol pathway